MIGKKRNVVEDLGLKSSELGTCVAVTDNFGHTCWVLTGTLCGGKVNGGAVQKKALCRTCDVYKSYNRTIGSERKKILTDCVDEQSRFSEMLFKKINSYK